MKAYFALMEIRKWFDSSRGRKGRIFLSMYHPLNSLKAYYIYKRKVIFTIFKKIRLKM